MRKSCKNRLTKQAAMVFALATAVVPAVARAQAGALQASFDGRGFASLAYHGVDLLADGEFRLAAVFFRTPAGDVYAAELPAGSAVAEPGSIDFASPWGSVRIAPTVAGDTIDLRIAVDNHHALDHLVGLYLELGRLRFPQPPTIDNRSWLFYTKSNMGHNLGQPGIVAARFDSGLVAICNEQLSEPLASGFGNPPAEQPTVLPVLLYTARHPLARERFPFIDRPIRAGGRDHYRVSLRFAPADANLTELTADLYRRFADTYPYELNWPDRRPIGRIHLASASQNWPTNPRGWHHGFGAAALDTGSEAGKQEFARDLLRYADRVVALAKEHDAQGVVVWDVEGQEQPHMISYLGDPRSLPPEMELPVGDGDQARPVVDLFFAKLREAGLIPGLCIRPQRPLRAAYGNQVEQIAWIDRRARADNVAAKIHYAKQRWGCRIFYFDSDVQWAGDPLAIPGASGHSATTDPDLLRQMLRRFPDILILPEWEDLRCYAYAAPYTQLNYNKLTAPPDWVLATYPQAFFVNSVGVADGQAARDPLVDAVRRGDILFYTAWYAAPENALIRALYEAAAGDHQR